VNGRPIPIKLGQFKWSTYFFNNYLSVRRFKALPGGRNNLYLRIPSEGKTGSWKNIIRKL
jgi:hypothetical protein